MANCGMRVAMDLGVSCDQVSRFYRYFSHAGYDVWKRMDVQRRGGTIGPLRRSERVRGERWMSLSVNLALGGGNRVIRAQRIC